MSDHEPMPVAGYTAQSDEKIALVNRFKQEEERILRTIDEMFAENMDDKYDDTKVPYDARWIALAKTHFQEGFMALNRAVFQPQRIKLPEDK